MQQPLRGLGGFLAHPSAQNLRKPGLILKTMNKTLISLLLFFPLKLYGFSVICHPDTGLELEDRTALDRAYEEAEIVFLANVALDKKSYWPRWQYSVITPVLKGEVEPEGYLELDDNDCDYVEIAEKGIYLVFWQKQNDRIANKNTKPIVYDNVKLSGEWVLIWAKSKAYTKANNPSP